MIKKLANKWIQIVVGVAVFFILSILLNNIAINLERSGLGFDFGWLFRPASFSLAEHLLPYSPSDTYAWALFMGWLNSLKVIFCSLFIATIIGFLSGLARTGPNSLLRILSTGYVTLIRQTPLLLQLMFWYFVGFLGIKGELFNFTQDIVSISNQGIRILGISLSSELTIA